MPPIDSIDFKVLSTLSAEQAHKYRVIPSEVSEGIVKLFAPANGGGSARELEFLLGKKVALEEVPPPVFDKFLGRYYPYDQRQRRQRAQADLCLLYTSPSPRDS